MTALRRRTRGSDHWMVLASASGVRVRRCGGVLLLMWALGAGGAGAQGAPTDGAAPIPVKIHDTVVFSLRTAHGGQSAPERARAASDALLRAVEARDAPELRLSRAEGVVRILAGRDLIVELNARDAGEEPLDAYATAVSTRIGDALRAERRRSQIAATVLSASLAVFLGLCALYVLRKIGEFASRARAFTDEHPDRIPSIRLQRFEVIGPAAMRGAVFVGLLVGRWLLQLSVVYLWLVFTLSLFSATRPYTERLTGFVLSPLSDMTARLAASLPLLLLALISVAAVYVLLRFVRLFFASVARGETRLNWLPADLAAATSWLSSFGIVTCALVFVAPMITGDREGALSRAGTVVLFALGLALTPLFASGALGTVVVFGRRLRVGQHIEVAGRSGRVRELNLLELRLGCDDGSELRLPHLLCLVHPLRILSDRPRLRVELSLHSQLPQAHLHALLLRAAQSLGERARAELLDVHADGARYRVEVAAPAPTSEGDLRMALAAALHEAGVGLGRSTP